MYNEYDTMQEFQNAFRYNKLANHPNAEFEQAYVQLHTLKRRIDKVAIDEKAPYVQRFAEIEEMILNGDSNYESEMMRLVYDLDYILGMKRRKGLSMADKIERLLPEANATEKEILICAIDALRGIE